MILLKFNMNLVMLSIMWRDDIPTMPPRRPIEPIKPTSEDLLLPIKERLRQTRLQVNLIQDPNATIEDIAMPTNHECWLDYHERMGIYETEKTAYERKVKLATVTYPDENEKVFSTLQIAYQKVLFKNSSDLRKESLSSTTTTPTISSNWPLRSMNTFLPISHQRQWHEERKTLKACVREPKTLSQTTSMNFADVMKCYSKQGERT